MKTSNRSSFITGIALLVIAALFSISLILQPLDFGVSGPGHNNIFFLLGNMLYSVYGFSSILIPAFLLIAGLSCFASKWTARKTMRLLTALVPFFTCVITENICRSILALEKGSFSGLKIAIAVITGLMLVVIEWLGIGIIADKLNNKTSSGKSYNLKPASRIGRISIPKEDDEESIFDEALSKLDTNSDEKTLAEAVVEEADKASSDQTAEKSAAEENQVPETEDSDEAAPSTPLLTQEEYAALTGVQEEVSQEEDLGWNLPPAPEKLPPEYDEDYDENDPALEFPPKEEDDEEIKNTAALEPVDSVEEAFAEEETAPAFDIGFDEEAENAEDDFDERQENVAEEDPYDDISLDTEFAEDEEEIKEEETPEKKTLNKESPYSTARYIDSVVENPNFPHGITIHDEDEPEEEKPQPAQVEKPKYPAKIQIQSMPEKDEEFDSDYDDYVEDETLPFPDFDIEKPAYQPEDEEEVVEETVIEESPDYTYDDKAEEDGDDYPEEEIKTEVQEPVYKPVSQSVQTQAVQQPVQQQPVKQEEAGGVAAAAFSVFSDMENEIREQQAANPQPVIQKTVNAKEEMPSEEAQSEEKIPETQEEESNEHAEVDFEGKVIKHDNTPNLEASSGARNLTADELTDFFNAQQAENTPQTTEIAANPPKIGNRAEKKGPYVIPSDLLIAYKDDEYWVIDDATKQSAMNLKQTLSEFNIEAKITGIKKGPVVTMFEILPAPGVKLSKIVALQDNIALSLAAQSVRIVAPIPGKQAVGIEVPNRHRSVVGFREIIEMDLPEWQKMAVPVVLGKDILGKAQLIDLVKTPHMLIAGATGSGKSVCVNSLILSILYKRSYHDVKLILVDPKVVELKLYNNIPHLLTPVITEPKKALQALQYCLCEMERRYALLDGMGVRDISNYNAKIKEQNICTEKLPYIVVIIDEFADLMATSGKELENIVARLTAMSRAVGIHLVLATQRPSVNVITGLIKANIPTRIAFMVASRTDSNIIIDTVGAEKLLGRGDMLYASAVDPAPIRIQGTFVTDQEVEDVVNAVKEYGEPDYIDDEIFVEDDDEEGSSSLFGDPAEGDDPLYDQALEIVVQSGKASASYLQRRLKIGYNRAARLVEEMEERGIVGPANGAKPREVIHVP